MTTVTIEQPTIRIIKVENDKQVVLTEDKLNVVKIAERGLQGLQGGLITGTGGEGGVLAYQVVYLDSSNRVRAANAYEISHYSKVIGMTIEPITENGEGRIAMMGEVTNPEWNLTPTQEYFLSTGGELSPDMPLWGFVQSIGVAKNHNTLIIIIGEPIRRRLEHGR